MACSPLRGNASFTLINAVLRYRKRVVLRCSYTASVEEVHQDVGGAAKGFCSAAVNAQLA